MARKIWMAAGLALACVIASGQALAQSPNRFSGIAAYYDKDYKDKLASGERYNPAKFTAAHRTLPFGTRLRITDPKTKRSVTVTVNDRGPFTEGRVIDLSMAAAKKLGILGRGLAPVTVVVLPPPPITTAAKPPAR